MIVNGQVDPRLLVRVGSERLRSGTASRWALVCAEVARQFGWTPVLVLSGGYRDLISQATIFRARYTAQASGSGPYGDIRWWNGVRYVRTSPLGAAAVPGTSNHGLGTAIDPEGLGTVGNFTSSRRAQFATVATRHGFSDAEGRAVGEPWHWVDTLNPDVITASTPVASTPTAPTVTTPAPLSAPLPEEDDMFEPYMIACATYTVLVVPNGAGADYLPLGPSEVEANKAAGVKVYPVLAQAGAAFRTRKGF